MSPSFLHHPYVVTPHEVDDADCEKERLEEHEKCEAQCGEEQGDPLHEVA